jgi:hypothetical protein
MGREENQPDRKLDGAKEGDRGSGTTQKVASESVTDEPQAQPKTKFTTFSGTDEKKLTVMKDGETLEQHAARQKAVVDAAKVGPRAAAEFVIEDKSKGVEHTSSGPRSAKSGEPLTTRTPDAGDTNKQKRPDAQPPRQSFMDGLKKIFDTTKSPEQAAQLQGAFSIEYMMRKAKAFISNAFNTNLNGDRVESQSAANPIPKDSAGRAQPTEGLNEAQLTLIASKDDGLDALFKKMRGEQAEKAEQPEARGAEAERHLSDEALHVAAKTLHEAINANYFGVPIVDGKTIVNTLDPITPADRAALLDIYRADHKVDFEANAAGRLLPQDELQLRSLLRRTDEQADDLGSIERSLYTVQVSRQLADASGVLGAAQYVPMGGDLRNVAAVGHALTGVNSIAEKQFAERQLRETLGSLSAEDLDRLAVQFAKAHDGQTLQSALLNNPNLSDATREALAIYLKKGANLDEPDARTLAEIGLKYNNADIFEEAFVNKTNHPLDKLRSGFSDPARQKEIEEKFGWRAEIAKDVVQTGDVRTSSLIHGDTHWYGSNKEHIAFALQHMSKQERDEFTKGMLAELAKDSSDESLPPFSAYSEIHKALQAAGTPREVAMWEAQITRGGGLIAQLAALHDDGIPVFNTGLRINEHHDAHKMLRTVDNMTEQDWTALHNDPAYRKQLDQALPTFLKDNSIEDWEIRYLIDSKLSARTYEESKTVTAASYGIKLEKPEAEPVTPKMDLPPDTHPCDIIKAYLDGAHNVSIDDVRRTLNNPALDLGAMKNEFAQKHQQDLSAKLLGKVDPLDRLEMLRLLTPGARNARQDFYDARFDAKEHSSVVADPMMTALSNSSKVQQEEHLNRFYGVVQANASNIDQLSQEKQAEIEAIFSSSTEISRHYSTQNHEFTEQFTDASIGVAAGVAAPFTAGGSWELYVGLMAVGGTYKAAMRPVLEGGNYQGNPLTVGKDIFTGGIGTLVAVAGPEMLGINKLAASSTAKVLLRENAELFAKNATRQELERDLAKVSEDILSKGAKNAGQTAEKDFAELTRKYAAPGHEDQLKELMSKTLAEKTLPLARNALTKTLYERGLVMAAGGAGGGVNEVATHIFDKDHKDLGKQAIQGILIGAISAAVLDAAFHGTVKLVKATRGKFAGQDVVQVKAGNLEFQTVDGTTFHEPNGNFDITGDLRLTKGGSACIDGPEKTVVGDTDGNGIIIDNATGAVHRFDAHASAADSPGSTGSPKKPTPSPEETAVHPAAESADPSLQQRIEAESTLQQLERVESPKLSDRQPGLENESDLFIVNLRQQQALYFQGEKWEVVRFDPNSVTLARLTEKNLDRNDLASRFGMSQTRVSELEVGSRVWDHHDREFKVVKIEGNPPNQSFVLLERSKSESRFDIASIRTEHPDIIAAKPEQLLDSRGDVEIAALGRGEITLGEKTTTGKEKNLPWYHATCKDPVTHKEYNIVFRGNATEDHVGRMHNEVRTQWLFREIGLDNGFPATAIRKVRVEGQEMLGFVQKWEGEPVKEKLPELIESKLYPEEAANRLKERQTAREQGRPEPPPFSPSREELELVRRRIRDSRKHCLGSKTS